MPTSRGRRARLGKVVRACALIGLFVMSACSSGSDRAAPARGTHTAGARVTAQGHSTPAAASGPRHWSPSRPLTLDDIANGYIAHMTLDEELGQLFLVALAGTDYNANNAGMIEQMHAGGIILYAINMTSVSQTRTLIATAQAHADFPLIVVTDEEGGWVDRLKQFYGFRPSATMIGQNGSPDYAYSQGERTGQDMAALGFNTDFAPDVDVQLVDGPDQSSRTFGSTPDAVSSLAGAYLNGLQNAGVIGTLKHFPGLGAATTDAHLSLPVINRTRNQLEAVELAPYRTLIASGQVQMIMTTDLLMPALDPTLPAEISPAIITGVLRGELGYNGVVVTDALYMDGISRRFDEATAGVMALVAGDDLLVGAFSPDQMRWMEQAIRTAMANGVLTKARIDQSVRRILVLKMRAGMIPVPAGVLGSIAPLGSMTPLTVPGPLALVPRR
jgi:beta-N-acetylhexosaminidase